MNMDIWETGTLNELFIRGSYTQIKFSKQVFSCKTAFFVTDPFYHSVCLNISF